jgi:LytS/YehU family sensor histidine kinase
MNSTPASSWFRHLRGARPSYWVCQGLFWGGLWLADIPTFGDHGQFEYPLELLLLHGGEFVAAVALSHVWRAIIRCHGWHVAALRAALLPLFAGSVVLAVVLLALSAHARVLPMLQLPLGTSTAVIGSFLLVNLIKCIGWSAVYYGYHAQDQLRSLRLRQLELESAARGASLQALRAQVNPHFFFNSLNTLRCLIDEDPAKARNMVTQLAKIFRSSLQQDEPPLISLRAEWETVSAYLDIESLRFESRLRVSSEVSEDTLDCLIPPFLLQTLVENAIKFGVSPQEAGGEIDIRSERLGTLLRLCVSNTGTLATASDDSTGLGLRNARERLRLLFGDRASLALAEASGQVIATAELPATA